MKQTPTVDTLVTPMAEVKLEGEIMYFNYHVSAPTMEDAQEHIRMIRETFADKIPTYAVSDLRAVKNASKDVRNYLGSEEVASLCSAAALIIGSGLSKIVGNLFMKFSKPKYPTKLFTSPEKAEAWILELKNN